MRDISRDEIEALIPHKGTMCLLDTVTEWDEHNILCTTLSHTRPNNPLRKEKLSAVHSIEYGAQAMAIHGALIAQSNDETLCGGYLVAVRNIQIEVKTLSDISGELEVAAKRLMSNSGNLIYEFTVHSKQQMIASGKVTVIQHEAVE